MSSKNELQEFFQKNKLSLPEYTTDRIGGDAHTPEWLTVVELCDGSTHRGDIQATKKKAELNAATNALKHIQNAKFLHTNPLYDLQFNKAIKIFVDIENKPNFIEEFVNKVSSKNIEVHGFVSNGHPQFKPFKDNRISIYPIPSTRKDGADVGLIMHVGMILRQEQSDETVYIIVSNDHFADALVDCIKIYKKEAYVCRSFEDVISTFQELYER